MAFIVILQLIGFYVISWTALDRVGLYVGLAAVTALEVYTAIAIYRDGRKP